MVEYQPDKVRSREAADRNYHFPEAAEELLESHLFNQWWYYSVELMPRMSTKGAYPDDFPMLPRIMLRNCNLAGTACLDMGSMEGMIPVLMKRGGAASVLATDASDHCQERMAALKHYYGVQFDFKQVGLMYDLNEKLKGYSFDLVNCSGLLYHVISPIDVLMGVRPLVRRNGLVIVSTNVTFGDGYVMEFNNAGRLQAENNTFWYISVGLLEYILRLLRLSPIDATFLSHSSVHSVVRLKADRPTGYLSVVCRAVDELVPDAGDEWAPSVARGSWEYLGLCDWKNVDVQPRSTIAYRGSASRAYWNSATDSLDLKRFVSESGGLQSTEVEKDTHLLRLADQD